MKKKKFLDWLIMIVTIFVIALLASFSYFSYILWIGGGQNLTKIEEKQVYIAEPQIAEATDRVSSSLLIVFPKTDLDNIEKNLTNLTFKCFLHQDLCPVNLRQGLIYSSDGVVLVWFDDLKVFDQNKDWKAIGVDGTIYDLEKIGLTGENHLVKFKIWKNGELSKKTADRKQRYNWPILNIANIDNLKIGQNIFVGDLSVADQNIVVNLGNIIYLKRSMKVSNENKNELIFKNIGINVSGDILNKVGHFVFDDGGQLIGVLGNSGTVFRLYIP